VSQKSVSIRGNTLNHRASRNYCANLYNWNCS